MRDDKVLRMSKKGSDCESCDAQWATSKYLYGLLLSKIKGWCVMASNKIKALPINVIGVYDAIAEAIANMIHEMDVSGVGDNGDTEFEIEVVQVKFIDGQFVADIDLQRISGLMVTNAELEDYFLDAVNQQTVTVECEVEA